MSKIEAETSTKHSEFASVKQYIHQLQLKCKSKNDKNIKLNCNGFFDIYCRNEDVIKDNRISKIKYINKNNLANYMQLKIATNVPVENDVLITDNNIITGFWCQDCINSIIGWFNDCDYISKVN